MKLMDLIMTPVCEVCLKPISGREDLFCKKCRVDYDRAKEACRLHHHGVAVKIYTEWDTQSERLGSAVHLVEYEPQAPESVVTRLIVRLKSGRDRRIAEFFAKELAALVHESEAIPSGCEPIITWIPRRVENAMRYGGDHMERIAKALSRMLSLPTKRLLGRRFISVEQKHLGRKERSENARRTIYMIRKVDIRGQTILLLDDIITTGASMETAARILIENGARTVIGVAIAATVRRPKPSPLSETFLLKRGGEVSNDEIGEYTDSEIHRKERCCVSELSTVSIGAATPTDRHPAIPETAC